MLDSRELPGQVTAGGAEGVNPADYDLVGLCMQEPQYRSPGVRELLDEVVRQVPAPIGDADAPARAIAVRISRTIRRSSIQLLPAAAFTIRNWPGRANRAMSGAAKPTTL